MRRLIFFSCSVLIAALPVVVHAETDSDGDGYPDALELWHGYDPHNSQPVKLEKWIEINLERQRLAYYTGSYQIAEHPISGGKKGWPTPKGTFKILNKHPRAWSRSASLWMPWWMAFAGGGKYGIHELPEWPNGRKEGVKSLGKPASHGCVRLGTGPAKNLYDWAAVGTRVVVR